MIYNYEVTVIFSVEVSEEQLAGRDIATFANDECVRFDEALDPIKALLEDSTEYEARLKSVHTQPQAFVSMPR